MLPNWAPNMAPDDHEEHGDHVHVAHHGVPHGPVAAGDGNLEQVGAHRDVGGRTDDVDQGRHADETARRPPGSRPGPP